MNSPGRLDTSDRVVAAQALANETIDAVIDSLLGAAQPPYVLGVDENGLAIPLPPSVPVTAGFAIGAIGSALELCIPADLTAVVEAWERARTLRGAQAQIHLRNDPQRGVTLHIIDARHRFGIYLAVIVGGQGVFDEKPPPVPLFRPRLCTTERDELSVITAIDTATTQILGWSVDELVGSRSIDLVHPDDRPAAIANWMEMLRRPGSGVRLVLRYRHKDGKYIWFETTHRNLLNEKAHGRVLTEMVDVSERMEAIDALRASEQLLRRLTETLPLGIAQIDGDGRIVYHNRRLLDIVGTPAAATIDAQFARVAPADRSILRAALDGLMTGRESPDLELTIEAAGGSRRCSVAMRGLCSDAAAMTGALICVSDITERVRLREELERRAKFDVLTHCLNRAAILEALEAALARPPRPDCGVAVLFIDLDGFKAVNDRYGHAAGDELLKLTGRRLLDSVRTGDVVGRLGGDEFLVVCPDVTNPQTALEIAQRILGSLAQVAQLGGASVVSGSSIGVAWTDHVADCDTIVATADAAMYESKRSACGPVLVLR